MNALFLGMLSRTLAGKRVTCVCVLVWACACIRMSSRTQLVVVSHWPLD